MISFKVSPLDARAIQVIVSRYLSISQFDHDKLSVAMDLTACHANGCPLRLSDLAAADDFNLLHDVGGISRHLDWSSGKLMNCFVPRYAQPDHV